MTKIELMMETINWKIEDEEKMMEEYKMKMENEMKNFNPVTSPEWLLNYSQHLKEAGDKLKELHEWIVIIGIMAFTLLRIGRLSAESITKEKNSTITI